MTLDPAGGAQVLATIREYAARADHRDGSLAEEVAALHGTGWLEACLPTAYGGSGWGCEPAGTRHAFEALRLLGRANLSLARLFEGHMNAVKLVALHAVPALRERTFASVAEGTLLGVWGADAPGQAVTLSPDLTLSGIKRFASGLGVVGQAVLTAATGEDAQLLLAPVDDPARADASVWTMAGMRATKSGTYLFDGLALAPDARLGAPGDYFREPHFEGGIWRYCAAHLGAAEALYGALREALVAQGRAEDAHQEVRLVRAATAVETARLWLLRAALEVEAEDAAPGKAVLSLLARDVTEEACRTVIAQVERGLGMAAHAEGTPVERIRRDLALFLCQAAPDAKRARAARALVASAVLPEAL